MQDGSKTWQPDLGLQVPQLRAVYVLPNRFEREYIFAAGGESLSIYFIRVKMYKRSKVH